MDERPFHASKNHLRPLLELQHARFLELLPDAYPETPGAVCFPSSRVSHCLEQPIRLSSSLTFLFLCDLELT